MTTPNPNRRREIATITTTTQPSGPDLEAVERAFLEEGYQNVAAVPVPVSAEATSSPWQTKVFAEGDPYAEASK
jgi:hypothetical protein